MVIRPIHSIYLQIICKCYQYNIIDPTTPGAVFIHVFSPARSLIQPRQSHDCSFEDATFTCLAGRRMRMTLTVVSVELPVYGQ